MQGEQTSQGLCNQTSTQSWCLLKSQRPPKIVHTKREIQYSPYAGHKSNNINLFTFQFSTYLQPVLPGRAST